jgi:hypothetical protein
MEPTADTIERALQDFTADRLDLKGRLPTLIATAIRMHDDPECVGAFLRKGASVRIRPHGDGTADLTLEYGDAAPAWAALRAATWAAEPEDPPAVGSAEHDEVLLLTRFPLSALASLPRG